MSSSKDRSSGTVVLVEIDALQFKTCSFKRSSGLVSFFGIETISGGVSSIDSAKVGSAIGAGDSVVASMMNDEPN
jgi:hypothetical protein